MNLALYISAFTLGFLGSFHCAGMCGPIALMLPSDSEPGKRIVFGRFIYNTGRVITYISLGLIFGLLGLAAAIKGYQRELSVLTGSIVLVTTVLGVGGKKRLESIASTPIIANPIRRQLKMLFSRKTYFSLFLIGVLNGFLPCGFVYLAIAGALSTGSATGGAVYMALFGLGTFPIMMTISVFASYLGLRFRRVFSKLSPLIAILLALFLIYRGTDMKTEACCSPSKHACSNHAAQTSAVVKN